MDTQELVQRARAAIEAGEKQKARHLLQQAVAQQPDDFAIWLWLASVAPSPVASMEYVQRAEALNPTHPTVVKAKAWAQRRLDKTNVPPPLVATNGRSPSPTTSTTPATSPTRSRWPLWAAVGLLLLLLLGAAGFFLANGAQQAETAVLPPATSQPTIEATVVAPTTEPTETAVPPTSSPTPVPTERPERLLAKNVSDGQPRVAWTATPLPTNTPTPTPTPIPTVVGVEVSNWVGKRPFGVGDSERWIDVNLSTQSLNAFEGDSLVYSALVSSGLPSFPTVTGQFRTWIKYESQTMDGRLLGYDYYLEGVPYVMYFYEDYAIHGAYWHNNFGHPMSHGCVNVSIPDSQWLFNWAPLGTLVNVHY